MRALLDGEFPMLGDDPNLTYAGHSLILDPRGETLAIAGESPQLIQANLQLETLTKYRQEFPALRDLRPEYFRAI
jgi:omega-amidase